MRRLIWARWSGRLLAVSVAYLLALQALIASVGLGMSAVSAFGQAGFDICSSASGHSLAAPLGNGDQDKSDHRPPCPFCFVAAQSAGHLATISSAAGVPAYAEFQRAGAFCAAFDDGIVVSHFRRTTGDPRAPPQLSI